jgi:calcineurin-like phosphoesterase family protein
MTVWFSSDPHFRHRMVSVEKRGFATREEHDEAVIANVNAVVKDDDIMWWLGDMGLGHNREILPLIARCKGRKRLITGNHDAPWPANKDSSRHQREWLTVFEAIHPYARISLAGVKVLLSHFPYAGDHTPEDRHAQWRLRDEGEWLLHGHVHSEHKTLASAPRQVHVGLDAWDMKPAMDRDVARLVLASGSLYENPPGL